MAIENVSIDQHKNKVTYLLNVATIVITVVAISWAIFFISIQDWLSLAMKRPLLCWVTWVTAATNATISK